MGRHRYRTSGLSVESEVALPGMIALVGGDGAADVTIRRDRVGEARGGAGGSGVTWQVQGEQMLLHIPQAAHFRLTAGREIVFDPEPDAPLEDVVFYLAGSVLGALLHQRGLATFHASAVRIAGRAVLFCGPSGTGKSTLAAALGERGHALVAEDRSAVELGTVPMVQPDGRQLKLWTDSIERLGLASRCSGPVHRQRHDKSFVHPPASCIDALPIGAVYLLRELSDARAPAIESVKAVEAVAVLARNAYRPELMNDMDQHEQYFKAAAAIADSAGIFLLTRPRDLSGLPGIVERLERHWAAIGLAARAACHKTA